MPKSQFQQISEKERICLALFVEEEMMVEEVDEVVVEEMIMEQGTEGEEVGEVEAMDPEEEAEVLINKVGVVQEETRISNFNLNTIINNNKEEVLVPQEQQVEVEEEIPALEEAVAAVAEVSQFLHLLFVTSSLFYLLLF
jgi:hypothetical protein